ncbi:MAG: carboxylating nicotinate-nucleotide diphosphorylase [Nitrosopumilaceae archaeon]|nr:carboxylating nicotinate-nucleotide diphosphorylase [Nitrosopumilaceae archaeon]
MKINQRKELLRFLAEDVGKGDITSSLLPKKIITARIIAKQNGILAGVKCAKEIFCLKGCKVRVLKLDGSEIRSTQIVLEISGYAKSVLTCERTALNLLTRMSGIATQTNNLVEKIRKVNSKSHIFATRKTAPGLRFFDKEAVKIGGGQKHRMSLDEMVMIKDNHLAVGSITNLINKAKKKYKKIEIEVENQNDAILAAREGATIIMLDNFSPKDITKTIARLKKLGLRNKVLLEASGGINSKNIQAFAKTGVDMISVGEITNSVKGIDFSLEVS